MTWQEARQQFPHQWLLFEAVQARTEQGQWVVDDLTAVRAYTSSADLLRDYYQMSEAEPERDIGFFHTDRERLDIAVQTWVGVRPGK